MSSRSFTTVITVDQSPAEVFSAINKVRQWWEGDLEGETRKLGDEFTYRYKEFHSSTQKITEYVPDKKIVWHVVKSQLNFVQNKTEWDGTDIIFEITQRGDKTQLRFTHRGLTPAFECYDDCSGAWSEIVRDSLCSLITKGTV
jgi:uncharacterized protein YndB with AHSA1/START domain